MKILKILLLITSFLFTTGFATAPLVSLLAPTTTIIASGNIIKASAQFIIDQGVKMKTGKNSFKFVKDEIDKIESGKFEKKDNPIINAPHTYLELSSDEWKHSYSRAEAAFPKTYLKEYKYWAPVARVDNVYGDRNLVCSCPSMDEYKDAAA